MPDFVARSQIDASPEETFAWHARPGALERLTPPWEPVEVLSSDGHIRDGARVVLRVGLAPGVKKKWVAEHRDFQEGRSFRDVQVSGPFARWIHTHSMRPSETGGTELEDRIEYDLPAGAAGKLLGDRLTRAKLEAMFAFRHDVTRKDIAAHRRFAEKGAMRVLISGSTGLVGSQLVPFLTTGGHEVVRLRRSASDPSDSEIGWSPREGRLDASDLEGFDAVVHLAGESIFGRWTQEKKEKIRRSRTEGTRLLCERLASLQRKPKVLVSASAIGIYGNRGAEELDESSALPAALSEPVPAGGFEGSLFLAEVGKEWEQACEPARDAGIRVVNLRIGIVLTPTGGALQKMLPLFKAGLGGRLGGGDAWWSWIALDDLVGAIHFCLLQDDVAGPINATASEPVTNAEFTRALGKILGRPTLLPVPSFGPKVLLGSELSEALLFNSAKVLPKKLQDAGYSFRYQHLDEALRHLLGKNRLA